MSITNWFGTSRKRATRLSQEEQDAFFRRVVFYLPRATVSTERRRGKRVVTSDLRIFLGWLADDDFHLIAADVINISPGGLMAYVEGQAPVFEQVVWVRRQAGPEGGESRRAVILEVRPEGIGDGRIIRLRFYEPDEAPPHAHARPESSRLQTNGALEPL